MRNLLFFIFCLSINTPIFGQTTIFSVAGSHSLVANLARTSNKRVKTPTPPLINRSVRENQLPTSGDLIINEIHYNPDGSDDSYEFIEIYNTSGQTLDIGGVTFTSGITYTFPSSTMVDAAEYIVIASIATTYSGKGYDVYQYTGGLINTGETIRLEDGNGNLIDEVTYGVSSPWTTLPNATGPTLSLFVANQNANDNDNANSWGASCTAGGTPGAANITCSAESEIVAVAASESTTISSIENTAGPLTATDGVQVWQFTINEGGSDLLDDDALPSIITGLSISIKPTESGVSSFLDAIKSADIFDGTTHLATATISGGSLTFSGSPLCSILEGASKTLSLRISLNENISQSSIDKKDFVFQITDGNVTVPTDGTSSIFEFTTPQSTDNQNKIEVVATSILFTNSPTDAFKDYAMSNVTVNGIDANENIDEDFSTTVSITSTGTLLGTPVTVIPSSGTTTFSNLTHTATGANLTLTASSTGFGNIISNTFNITELTTASPGDLVISEFMADPTGTESLSEYFELYNTTNAAININGWTIKDDGSDSHTISSANGTTIVPAYGFLVLGRSTNGIDNNTDVDLDYIYGVMDLANTADEIILKVGSVEICRLTYSDGNNFGAGVANELINLNSHPTGVTQGPTSGSHYQAATQAMTSGDLGSPGAIGQSLPVQLLYFRAEPNYQSTLLSWATANEENNDYFNVQRSLDGKNFETIGSKAGAGTTYEVQEYSFLDENPVTGLNYYRLQQIDFDKKIENHEIISVAIANNKNEVMIVPTQVHNQFNIIFKESINKNMQLEIYNINGQLVKSENMNINENHKTVNVAALQTGIYIVRMTFDNTIITQRFVKL